MKILAAACVLTFASHAAAQSGVRALDDRVVDPLAAPAGVTATVLLFASVDCPISNRYAPEVGRLHDEFAANGIRFTLVYPNPSETPAAIREHGQRFGYTMSIVRDTRHELVQRVGATTVPEAAVVDARGNILYLGRIDDRYVTFGVDRPTPTRRDLAEALTAVIAGREVAVARTQAVGCVIADFKQ